MSQIGSVMSMKPIQYGYCSTHGKMCYSDHRQITRTMWVKGERESAVLALRSLCETIEYPGEWTDNLHLGDLIRSIESFLVVKYALDVQRRDPSRQESNRRRWPAVVENR